MYFRTPALVQIPWRILFVIYLSMINVFNQVFKSITKKRYTQALMSLYTFYANIAINNRRDHTIVDFFLFLCNMGWKVTFLATPPKKWLHHTLHDQPIKHHRKGVQWKFWFDGAVCCITCSLIVTRTTCDKRAYWRNSSEKCNHNFVDVSIF